MIEEFTSSGSAMLYPVQWPLLLLLMLLLLLLMLLLAPSSVQIFTSPCSSP
jgi:hypothetical protein